MYINYIFKIIDGIIEEVNKIYMGMDIPKLIKTI